VKELVGLLKTLVVDRGKAAESDDVRNTLVTWALTQTAKEREESSPTALAGLVRELKSILPNPSPAPSSDKSEVLAIISALKGMQPNPPDPMAVLRQAKDLFAAPEHNAEPARNHIAELDQILGFAQKLAALRVTGGGERSGWDTALDFAKELGPTVVQPVLQMINNIMVLRSQGKGAPQGMQGAPAPPAAFDPYRDSAAMRVHARAMNTQAPPPPPPAQAPASAFNQASSNVQSGSRRESVSVSDECGAAAIRVFRRRQHNGKRSFDDSSKLWWFDTGCLECCSARL
jgi:hypothetical protein